MPAYIDLIRIDWHLAETPAELHEAIIAANERCTGDDHTFETVLHELSTAAAAHPWIVADALVNTGYNSFALLHARGGDVTHVEVIELPEGETEPVALPYDDLPFGLSPYYDSEDQLRETLEAIRPAKDGSFVATAGDDRFLVELTPFAWQIRKLLVATEPELFARLMRGDYVEPKAAGRDPQQKYSQALFWPGDMLTFLQTQALRLDRSLSYLVQYALKVANLAAYDYGKAAAARIEAKLAGGDKRQQTLYFTGYQLDLLEQHAARLDISLSTVAQTAVASAKREIEQMPDRVEPGFG